MQSVCPCSEGGSPCSPSVWLGFFWPVCSEDSLIFPERRWWRHAPPITQLLYSLTHNTDAANHLLSVLSFIPSTIVNSVLKCHRTRLAAITDAAKCRFKAIKSHLLIWIWWEWWTEQVCFLLFKSFQGAIKEDKDGKAPQVLLQVSL